MKFFNENSWFSNKRFYRAIEDNLIHKTPPVYTGAILTFLTVALFGWYAIRPTLQTILFLRREIADNAIVNAQMDEKIGKLIEANAVYQSIQEKLHVLADALPLDPHIIDSIDSVRTLANESGASLSAISVSASPLIASQSAKTQKNSPLTSLIKVTDIPVNITLSGTFTNLNNFLKKLTTSRRIITIDSIKILQNNETSGAGGEGPLQMTARVTLHYIM